MKFDTPVYHPNISSQTVSFDNHLRQSQYCFICSSTQSFLNFQGAICLVSHTVFCLLPPPLFFNFPTHFATSLLTCPQDILKNQWTPVLTLKSALISLQSLLSTPEPRDPQDAQVAAHYLRDQADFAQTARYWTEVYADDPRKKEGERKQPRPPAATGREERKNEEVVVEEEELPQGITKEAVKNLVNMGFERGVVVRLVLLFVCLFVFGDGGFETNKMKWWSVRMTSAD
ncbi:hypothetical protein BC937DRAFT_89132 [Endogone sp. FLAS-F59071]|nr:hypothetical protein BC937DRAFT_89132 [Endogone sp. FLAS-F59071]|eukprot:RUS18117.1 hypothetical protein BC937DRAFT_89132 [Endogone sp. FLAS-F59071]